MKKKISSIAGKMSGRTKIALVISLLVVSVIAAGAIFNWSRLSGQISAKASPILQGEGDYSNSQWTYSDSPNATGGSATSELSAQDLDALNHIGGGPTTATFQQKVLLVYRVKKQWPNFYPAESANHSYNFKTNAWTCPELTGDVSKTEWVMNSTGCAIKKGSTSTTTTPTTIIPTTSDPTGCQKCDSNIVCSCKCS